MFDFWMWQFLRPVYMERGCLGLLSYLVGEPTFHLKVPLEDALKRLRARQGNLPSQGHRVYLPEAPL